MQETFEDVSMDESSSNAINAEQLGAAKRGGNGGGGAMSSSHPSEDSETGNRSKVTTASAESVEREIAKKETSIVIRLRLFVFLFLSAVATFVASAVYLYLFTTEQDKFITTFHEDADKILEAIGARIHKSFGLLDSLAVLFISFSQVTKQQFPYVTMNDFAVRMAKVLPLTDSISISILPVVTAAQRDEWEAYTLRSDQWVNDSVKIQRNWEWYHGPSQYNGTQYGRIHGEFGDVPDDSTRDMLVSWQSFPVIPDTSAMYNIDYLTRSFNESYITCLEHHTATISEPYMIPDKENQLQLDETKMWKEHYRNFIPEDERAEEPISDIAIPIIDNISEVTIAGADGYDPSANKAVGAIVAQFFWRQMFRNILPSGSNGIRIVVESSCNGKAFTYQVSGQSAEYIGVGAHFDSNYDTMNVTRTLHNMTSFAKHESMYTGPPLDTEYCPITLRLYPSKDMEAEFVTHNPVIFTAVTVLIFVFTSLIFLLYDSMVEKRQRAVMQTALHTSAIVSSLFPSAVRDRIFAVPKSTETERESLTSNTDIQGSPIANLYPETTVLFADICGFTAWSATRTPTQVFHLLETLYAAFDKIAKQRGVFKVETIGDCYVAVVGLPTPRRSHAVVMTRFAIDCRNKMQELVVTLEESLGVGTSDLALRIGLNSGPTTAGVLRGEKSRFQLFGDTVNTAARMESSGSPNRIHISEKTADLIRLAGKGHWLNLRDEQCVIKGKGLMTTFWCEPKAESHHSSDASSAGPMSAAPRNLSTDELDRLIAWNCDIFLGLLGQVTEARASKVGGATAPALNGEKSAILQHPVSEVAEVLSFPRLSCSSGPLLDIAAVNPEASQQLNEFIATIADLYQQHPFHNFEHCSHVVMSTKRMLDMVQACPSDENAGGPNQILSHPLTRFGIMFAALIHDVDHPGVSNAQLTQEQHALARKYHGKGVAEQNSIDLAWTTFVEPRFAELRECLFRSEQEAEHLRKIVVNVVMATDLFDRDMKAMRESRWVKSFGSATVQIDAQDRRATAILDLIIQASDVSHTMQHFSVYKKWNRRLLNEMYDAYKRGRTPKDPTEGWYEGELWFFDNYIIPLAQKLLDCGAFGSSCADFLSYAKDNRKEWELNGKAILRDVVEDLRLRHE